MNTINTLLPSVLDEARTVARTDKQDERHVTLLHDFNQELRDVLDFVDRLKQFKAMDDLQGFGYVHHLSTYSEGWDHSVYCPRTQTLVVNCFSARLMMPESSWDVTSHTATREVVDNNRNVKSKVWTLYRNDAFQERWEVSHNDHPRDPLRLRQGYLPADGKLLVKELIAQLESNSKRNYFRPYIKALGCWEVKPTFNNQDMQVLWGQCAVLQHLHSCSYPEMIDMALRALDPLTADNAYRNLSRLVDFFIASPMASAYTDSRPVPAE